MARILSICVASILCGSLIICTPAKSWSETITANGLGVLPAASIDPVSAPLTLFASVEGEGADASSAIAAVNGKLAGLTAALEKVGVAPSSIQVANFSLYPQFAPSPTDPSAPPTITKHEAYIGIQVVAGGLEKAGTVINAVLGAGATNVSTSIASANGQASSGDMALAVSDAMGQARTLAMAAATNAGVRLGRLISVEIKPAGISGSFTFLTGADLAGARTLRPGGQAIEVSTTYEALP